MPLETFTCPMRGMHFHPPAKVLLEVLQPDTTVFLEREPDNPYDANAIRVMVDSDHFASLDDPETFDTNLQKCGYDTDALAEEPAWMLGYVAKEFAVHLASILDSTSPEEVTLLFDGANKPLIKIVIEI